MSVKYQIFISSTFDDLRAEREQVLKAVLEMGHIPVGMEMFSAADDEQWRLIAKHIDESDYYVVIIAQRYGSMAENISFTEKEYDFAVAQGVPVLGFILDETAPWPSERGETDAVKQSSLRLFKEKVRRKPVGFWRTADDLHAKVSIALMKAFNAHPRAGWIRSSAAVGADVMRELSRLSAENADLRKEIASSTRRIKRERTRRYSEAFDTLSRNEVVVPVRLKKDGNWDHSRKKSLLDIFSVLAPSLMSEKSERECSELIAIHTFDMSQLVLPAAIPTNFLSKFLADLATLDLVQPSPVRKSVNDSNRYWVLTPEGNAIYKALRLNRLRTGSRSDEEPSDDSEDPAEQAD